MRHDDMLPGFAPPEPGRVGWSSLRSAVGRGGEGVAATRESMLPGFAAPARAARATSCTAAGSASQGFSAVRPGQPSAMTGGEPANIDGVGFEHLAPQRSPRAAGWPIQMADRHGSAQAARPGDDQDMRRATPTPGVFQLRNPCFDVSCLGGHAPMPPDCRCCKVPAPKYPSQVLPQPCGEYNCPCPIDQHCFPLTKNLHFNYLSSQCDPENPNAPCFAVVPGGGAGCAESRSGECPDWEQDEKPKFWSVEGCGCLKHTWMNGAYPPICPSAVSNKVNGIGFDCCDPCPGGLPLQDGSCYYDDGRACGVPGIWTKVADPYAKSVAYALQNGLIQSVSALPLHRVCPASCNAEPQCFCPGADGANRFQPAKIGAITKKPYCSDNFCQLVYRSNKC